MLQQFIQWVKDLYGRITGQNIRRELVQGAKHREEYEDATKTNITSIFSNALSTKTVSDSTMTISDSGGGESKRSAFISMCLKSAWDGIKKTADTALGKGGVFLVPYVSGSRVFVSVLDQTDCDVLESDGDGNITSIAIRAETAQVDNAVYVRTVYMELNDFGITIQQKAVDRWGKEVPLETVPAWASIEPERTIGNVDRILAAYLRCPKSDRKADTYYGVPITYGCGETIEEIVECLHQIRKEFDLKQVFVGADDMLFGKDGKLPANGLFRKFKAATGLNGGKSFWEIFDPAFRDSSYYNRYHELCAQLEKEVGTSRGILTEPSTAAATATEIKAANKATFDIVFDLRKGIEKCFDDLAYAVDVYAEHYGLTPAGAAGDYSVTFDWDMSMLESTEETFSQYSELQSRGLITAARLVSYSTGMSMEDAQAEVDAATEEAAQKAAPIIAEDLEP